MKFLQEGGGKVYENFGFQTSKIQKNQKLKQSISEGALPQER